MLRKVHETIERGRLGCRASAFQQADMKRKKAESQIEESSSNFSLFDEESGPTVQEKNMDGVIGFSPDELQEETQASGVNDKEGLESDVLLDDEVDKEDDEPETLSDIDDAEVNEYLLHDEEEKRYKRIIWEEMNKEYLEVRKREPEEDDTGPAKTPFEATCNVLKKKGLALKVNLDAIGSLYDMDDTTFEKEEAETEEKTFNKFAEFEENAENGLDEFDFVHEFVCD